jgi:hypothetical protein
MPDSTSPGADQSSASLSYAAGVLGLKFMLSNRFHCVFRHFFFPFFLEALYLQNGAPINQQAVLHLNVPMGSINLSRGCVCNDAKISTTARALLLEMY